MAANITEYLSELFVEDNQILIDKYIEANPKLPKNWHTINLEIDNFAEWLKNTVWDEFDEGGMEPNTHPFAFAVFDWAMDEIGGQGWYKIAQDMFARYFPATDETKSIRTLVKSVVKKHMSIKAISEIEKVPIVAIGYDALQVLDKMQHPVILSKDKIRTKYGSVYQLSVGTLAQSLDKVLEDARLSQNTNTLYDIDKAKESLEELISKYGNLDIILVCSGG